MAYASPLAEEKEGGLLPLRAMRAHEVRDWASSLALKGSVRMGDIMNSILEISGCLHILLSSGCLCFEGE